MTVDRQQLESMDRDQLIAQARALGAVRPEVMTKVELRDEIIRLSETDEVRRQKARGWLGVARDLVASVVEQGLHLPDAAELIRGGAEVRLNLAAPVATVTLAEIYASQGHVPRAISMLNEVLAQEPDHELALALHERLCREFPEAAARVERREAGKVKPPRGLGAGMARRATPASIVESVPSFDSKAASSVESSPSPAVDVAPTVEEAAHQVAESAASASSTPAQVVPVVPAVPSQEQARDLLVVESSGGVVRLYWQLSDAQSALQGEPDAGRLVVRLAEYIPTEHGPERRERDLPIATERGELVVTDVAGGAATACALGRIRRGRFLPLTIGLESSGGEVSAYLAGVLGLPLDEALALKRRVVA